MKPLSRRERLGRKAWCALIESLKGILEGTLIRLHTIFFEIIAERRKQLGAKTWLYA